MKTFVINLDKNINRMEHMDAQLKRLGIAYERVPAVYGAALTKVERKRDFSAFRSRCASGYKLRDGEIGCALSHCLTYRKMVEEEILFSLILEDDVKIVDAATAVIKKVEEFITPSKPQVVLLSAHAVKDRMSCGIERISEGMCTDGYVITLPAAELILKANYPVLTVADKWRRWEKRYGIEMYRAWPTVVKQDNATFGTDISFEKIYFGKGLQLLVHKALRVLECVIDFSLFKVMGR